MKKKDDELEEKKPSRFDWIKPRRLMLGITTLAVVGISLLQPALIK